MEIIRSFDRLGKNDVGIAGGKGASLGEMTQAGIPVPPGFVLLAGAFERFLQESDLAQELDTILDQEVNRQEIRSVDLASEKIRQLIMGARMPDDIAGEILEGFRQLDADFVAVRSSATAEDSATAAWAGQLESYLNTTEETLLVNVQKCWASLFTPRAIFYRFEKGMHGSKISVAVVIQKMIQSEVSGIAFSVHPVTEDYNQMIIEAGYGLGEAIVSGEVTPDSYVIEKEPRRIIDKNITYQHRALGRAANGGNEWRELSLEEGTKPALSEAQSMELADIVLRIERRYGFPCDIEWAYEAGAFFITQSRPITTLSGKKAVTQKMMSVPYAPQDFTLGFEVSDQPVLFQEYLCRYYFPDGCVYTTKGQTSKSFVSTAALKRISEKGQAYFAEIGPIQDVSKQLEGAYETMRVWKDRWNTGNMLSPDEAASILELAAEIHRLYSYFYTGFTDGAYALDDHNSNKKQILAFLDQKKNDFRERYNNVFFDERGLYKKLLSQIGSLHGVAGDSHWYFNDELLALLHGSAVDPAAVAERKSAYVLTRLNEKVDVLTGDAASRFIESFEAKDSRSDGVVIGICAHAGKARGKVKIVNPDYSDPSAMRRQIDAMEKGDILVSITTSPELMEACRKAAAIVTDLGGMLSHAAIVSRELGIPCIIGTQRASKVLKDGDVVEVDAEKGTVRKVSNPELRGINSEQYDFLWRVYHKFLFPSMYMEQIYEDRDFVIIWSNEQYFNFVSKEERKRLGIEALDTYLDGFEAYKANARTLIEQTNESTRRYETADLSILNDEELAHEFESMVKTYHAVFKEYFVLDYHSTDEIARILKEEDTRYDIERLRRNVDEMGHIKFDMRAAWNPLVYPPKILKKFALEAASRLNLGEKVFYCRYQEIVALLRGENVSIPARLGGVAWGKPIGKEIYGDEARALLSQLWDVDVNVRVLHGQSGNRGVYRGIVRKIDYDVHIPTEVDAMEKGAVLVASSTGPEYMIGCQKAGAIVTDEGGIISHAAVVSREFGIPSVIGTQKATLVLQDGDEVEVDGDVGEVRVIKKAA